MVVIPKASDKNRLLLKLGGVPFPYATAQGFFRIFMSL